MITKDFTGGELDSLIALVEHGPLDDGDIPSKSGRDVLIKLGFAAKVVVKGEDGYQAATYVGRDAYLKYFEADTIAEAIKKRKAARTT